MDRMIRRSTRGCIPAWIAALAGIGCGAASIPLAPQGPHADNDKFVIVQHPPDVVQVQSVTPRPDDTAVWVDGYWHWSGRRWVWQPGAWTHPPAGAHYAPPQLVRIPAASKSQVGADYGVVYVYRAGHWHLADGTIVSVEPLSAGQ